MVMAKRRDLRIDIKTRVNGAHPLWCLSQRGL